ncbi:glycoside hydrolase family 3 N-terminal domain-containing protein [Bacillus salitolerans]|uniref:Glycoside hydrolase family 3 N-terminal domain-containing protein n=1 Tax=Bacillus salitolerans TaxID=1437434 RepID=A0ABW4LRS4_9BACI
MTNLTLRQKIGKLMVFGFQGDSRDTISPEIIHFLEEYHVGGIILFGRNMKKPTDILELTSYMQKKAKKSGHEQPLLICTDQENGIVRRLGKDTTIFPGAMLLAATEDEKLIYDIGRATAKELMALGINWNLAPVVDVNNNPHNPVIGVRSFGEKAEEVSRFSKASMNGMQAGGIITTLKHFPGHGDTNIDSHLDLPIISHGLERLERIELVPFKECMINGADTVMSAHVYFPVIESREGVPATMSHNVITRLLREKLGFSGVVTTDCMEMKAIADTIGTAKGAVEAIKAGVDLIMISHSPLLQKEAIEAIAVAVESGEIPTSRIEESLARISALKTKYVSWDKIEIDDESPQVPLVVGSPEHNELAKLAYKRGVTIVKNKNGLLPLSTDSAHKVMVIYPTKSYLTLVEDELYSENVFGAIVKEVHPSSEIFPILHHLNERDLDELVEKTRQFDTIVVGTLSAIRSKEQSTLLKALMNTGKDIVVIAMRNPYDLMVVPNVSGFITTYEFSTNALRYAVKALFGIETVSGKLPVTIPLHEHYQ